MEVFLRNLPQHIMDDGLQEQLQPFMRRLSIVHYMAEKQRNKNFGHVTFLHEEDGKKFLRHHGEESGPPPHGLSSTLGKHVSRTRARLTLMGKPVFCKLSNRPPNRLVLGYISQRASQRDRSNETPGEPFKVLSAVELSCGHYTFRDGRLFFTAEWTTKERCDVKFTKRSLRITIIERRIELRIPFGGIVELLWWEDGTAAVTLRWAPTILARTPAVSSLPINPHDALAALTGAFLGLGMSSRGQPSAQRLEAIDSQHRRVAPFCFVYYFRVPTPVGRYTTSDFEKEMHRAGKNQLFSVTRYKLGFRLAEPPGFDAARADLWDQLAQLNVRNKLPFEYLVLIQALVTNGYLHPTTVSRLADELVTRFAQAKWAGQIEPPVSLDAFKRLFNWIDFPSPDGDPRMFEVDGIMEYLQETQRQMAENLDWRSGLPENTRTRAQIFKVVVSPASIMLHGPEPEPMNRVLRKFPDHSYFIKAQFCDEDGQDLFFNSKVSLDAIYERFKSVLTNGISVAGRVYKLLGFSHSSLRAHAAWLSAPFFHQNRLHIPEFIITDLGDFNKIRSPARRAARIGQAFSETPYAINLDEAMIEVSRIPDVVRNGRVFSDGVGTISPGAAKAIYKVIPKHKGFPTCFQIRWAGAKGMLSLDSRLVGNKICIRDSMIKFESSDNQFLEICDMASEPTPMVLNRQLIKILEDMGAPRAWFINRQRREIERLRGIAATVYNTACFLRAQKIGESIQLYKLLRNIEAMGLDYRRDNFLRGVVEVVLLRELRLLKHKARIPVYKGATLFGVMDETGFLNEGEIYVTYESGGIYCEPPEEGLCIVSRSPALHPGDVQLAFNVIPPDGQPLRDLRNCIVFSKWGVRDLPSQLSGGDLDGDVFHVIWDPELIHAVNTFNPAEYARIPPLELTRPVQMADIASFFVDFMQTDHLGVIATRHMILADLEPEGTRHSDCIKLAELHSAAVDFSKTGRAVQLSHLPQMKKEFRGWRPDFLAAGRPVTLSDKSEIDLESYMANNGDEDDDDGQDGPRYKYYPSENVLGDLYRAVDEERIWADDIKAAISKKPPGLWEKLLDALEDRARVIGFVDWVRRIDEARQIRFAYQDAMRSVMTDFADHPNQPLRELEVFVGFIVNRTGIQSKRQRDRSVKLKDEFEQVATWITRQLRNPAPLGSLDSRLDAVELCLACLHVDIAETADGQIKSAARLYRQGEIESFRVIAAAALVCELVALEGSYIVLST